MNRKKIIIITSDLSHPVFKRLVELYLHGHFLPGLIEPWSTTTCFDPRRVNVINFFFYYQTRISVCANVHKCFMFKFLAMNESMISTCFLDLFKFSARVVYVNHMEFKLTRIYLCVLLHLSLEVQVLVIYLLHWRYWEDTRRKPEVNLPRRICYSCNYHQYM